MKPRRKTSLEELQEACQELEAEWAVLKHKVLEAIGPTLCRPWVVVACGAAVLAYAYAVLAEIVLSAASWYQGP